jgi:hypothetical protein
MSSWQIRPKHDRIELSKVVAKRSDSIRGGDACEILHLCAPKASMEQQELNLRVILLSQQEMGLSDIHNRLQGPHAVEWRTNGSPQQPYRGSRTASEGDINRKQVGDRP